MSDYTNADREPVADLARLDAVRVQAARRVLLVGEMNPYGADPQYALYPMPVGCAGHRLCYKILRLPSWVYMETMRVNLCEGAWSMPLAREAAGMIYAEHVEKDRRGGGVDEADVVVLLGRKVAEAFSRIDSRLSHIAPYSHRVTTCGGEKMGCTAWWSVKWVSIPHPSGLNRAMNAPGAFDLARDAVLSAAPRMFDVTG